MKSSDMWLDMETGGGELMSGFHHPISNMAITEGWAPNIALLQRSLVLRRYVLYPDSDGKLASVPGEKFDVVTDRHGDLPMTAISRVLKYGGWFITQQVGATNNHSLSRFLDTGYLPAYPDNTLLQTLEVCAATALA